MRRLLSIVTVVAPLALLVAWSCTVPRPLTPREMQAIRGGETELCYKDDYKDCDDLDGCGDNVVENPSQCPPTAWYDAHSAYPSVAQETFNSTDTTPGHPWYESKRNGDRFRCYQEWRCELIEMAGILQCRYDQSENGYLGDRPLGSAAPYETYTDGLQCIDEHAGG